MTMMANVKYAIYPGSIKLYDGSTKTWTAPALATAYGVQTEPYLTVNTNADIPQGMIYFD